MGQHGRALPLPHRRATTAAAAIARRTRAALAVAQPPPHRGAHRIPPDRVGIGIFHPLLRTGAPPFSRYLPAPDEAAHAALREALLHGARLDARLERQGL